MEILIQGFLISVTALLILIVTVLYAYFKYIYKYWSKKNIPYLEPTFPFGNAKDVILQRQNFHEFVVELYTKLKQKSEWLGGFYMSGKPMLMVLDPDIIKNILTKDFGNFSNRGLYSDEENDPLSAHLVTLDGSKWKNLRAKLTPTFTSGKMKMMFHTILKCCTRLEQAIDDLIKHHEAIDVKKIFSRLTTDTILSCAFGLECNSLSEPENEFRQYGKKNFQFGMREFIINLMTFLCPRLLKLLKIPQVRPDVSRFFMDILKQTIDYREKNEIHRKDFLDLLIRLKNHQSVLDDSSDIANTTEYGLTFNELAAQAFIFFGAGFETTSTTLNFCMFELATNNDIQENVRREVLDILKKQNGELNYEAVMQMKYMDKTLNEVLRKYPPVPGLNRECTENYTISGTSYVIEKGTLVIIPTSGLQRDPEFFPDPETFNPERFNDDMKSKRYPYAHLPFGEGPRNCIGTRFALLQIKIILSVLMCNFKFTLDPKTVVPIVYDKMAGILAPKNIIWLRAQRITS